MTSDEPMKRPVEAIGAARAKLGVGIRDLAAGIGQAMSEGGPAAAPADDKIARLLERIAERAEGMGDNQHVLTVLHDTVRALDRIRGREEALSDDWERVEIAQSAGPIVEFTGRRIAENTFQARGRQPATVTYELWETRQGVWIAVTMARPDRGRATASALQVPADVDPDRRRRACMEHWGWTDGARSMVRKLGWSLREDVL